MIKNTKTLSILALCISSCTIVNAAVEMKPRPKTDAEVPKYIEYLLEVAEPRTSEQRKTDDAVKARYKDAIVIDSLFVGAPGFPAGFSDDDYEFGTNHSVENQFNVISATISNGSDKSPKETFARIKATNEYWQENDKYLQVKTVEDMKLAKQKNKLGVFHNFQSMNSLGEDISNIGKYYQLGVKQMNFTYNRKNAFSSGNKQNSNGKDAGLTDLGKQAVREMNRLGMVVDCSHSSNQTCVDAANLSSKPMVLSHSNSMELHPIDRNASDKAIKAVAATGGVVCINFIGGFLNSYGDASMYSIAKHAEYIKNLVGSEAVCAGSDFVWNLKETLTWILLNPKQFPPEQGYGSPSQLGKPGDVWGIVKELETTYNWTEKEIKGFLGENLMRVYAANWK